MADHPGFPNPRPYDDSPLGRLLATMERLRLPRGAEALGPAAIERLEQALVERAAELLGCEPTREAVQRRWTELRFAFDPEGQAGPCRPGQPIAPGTLASQVPLIREERAAAGRAAHHPDDSDDLLWDLPGGRDQGMHAELPWRPRPRHLADLWTDGSVSIAAVREAWRQPDVLPCGAPMVLDEGAELLRPMTLDEMLLGWHQR